MARLDDVKPIAFFLPQFHPFPENDAWWGRGFTEWTNVAQATKLFPGHYQPHVPGDLGFCDLRLKETKLAQIDLAKKYGIFGFAYHYYWFSGRRIMHRPLFEMLADRDVYMPFCLCWANPQWNRKWLGKEEEILLDHDYYPNYDLDFISDAWQFLDDERYITVNGAPIIIIYHADLLPNLKRTIDTWNDFCVARGRPGIHVIVALTEAETATEEAGVWGWVEFPPHGATIFRSKEGLEFTRRIPFNQPFRGRVADYATVVTDFKAKDYGSRRVFKSVMPSWDNTPRMNDNARILLNSTRDNFTHWLHHVADYTADRHPPEEQFLFINAWNEWAEGCHLEPDLRDRCAYLEAIRDVLDGTVGAPPLQALSNEDLQKLTASNELTPHSYRKSRTKFGPTKLKREVKRVFSRLMGK